MARKVCSEVPAEPQYRLQLASILVRAEQYDEATRIYREIAADTEKISSTLRARALFSLVEIVMKDDRRDEAGDLLEQIAAMPLSDDDQRRAQVSLTILRHSGPAGLALRSIFWGSKPGRNYDRVRLVGRRSGCC